MSATGKTCATGAVRGSKFLVRNSERLDLRTSNRRPSDPPRFSRKSCESRTDNERRFMRNARVAISRGIFMDIMESEVR